MRDPQRPFRTAPIPDKAVHPSDALEQPAPLWFIIVFALVFPVLFIVGGIVLLALS